MIVGMDFGTTNSGMAVYDGQRVRLLPLDPASASPHVARTALYVTNDQTVTVGREAINRYFEHNVGRPVKLQRVWVGEVEVYGADMYYVTDVYAWVDVLSPGRLFLSIKSGLRDPDYQGTVVGQFYYSLENLIATYMLVMKKRAEQILERDIREVVLGRPVRFATDPQADALAQRRLLEAAFRAGFEKVYLPVEPVAAATHYATTAGKDEKVLVFDFGGGTLDITVMRLHGRRKREVLATGGIPVAGDIFDQKLVRAKLPRHFGEGTLYKSKGARLPLPKWVYDVFSDWQRVLELQTPQSRKLLREIAQSAEDPRGIKALISLVANNYALQMFDTVEAAKRKLSSDMATVIRFKGPGFRVSEVVRRREFEQIIRSEIQAIEDHLDETVRASGLAPREIDAVIRTGGSSNIPAFRYMLMDKFGRDKVLSADTYSSVTSGLGIMAYSIVNGDIDAKAYGPEEAPPSRLRHPSRDVPSVNLKLLQRRLETQEAAAERPGGEGRMALLLLAGDNQLVVAELSSQKLTGDRPVALEGIWPGEGSSLQSMLIAPLDERILLLTSRYRFLLTSAEALMDLQGVGLNPADFFHLQGDETICALAHWPTLKTKSRLVLVTTRGFARSYGVEGLVESIEGPAPLRFDQPLPGLPVAALAADVGEALVVALDSGRAVRYVVGELPLQGIQAIRRGDDERLAGALVAHQSHEILLVAAGVYGKRMPASFIPVPPKQNSPGRVLAARRPVTGIAPIEPGSRPWLVTNRHMVPLDPQSLPLDTTFTTETKQFLKLDASQEPMSLVTWPDCQASHADKTNVL